MEYANDYSGYGNDVLYRMCAERPHHDDVDTVKSKLWIIGRAYSVAIERKAGKNFKIADAAQIIINSPIDSWIDELKKIDRPNEANISKILEAHKNLVDLFDEATDLKRRSLASKYLHFHARKAVFLYDSRAKKELREILKEKKVVVVIPELSYDTEYAAFSYRCLHYREILEKELGELVTPRRLDMKLLGYWKLKQSQTLGQ